MSVPSSGLISLMHMLISFSINLILISFLHLQTFGSSIKIKREWKKKGRKSREGERKQRKENPTGGN